jgi:acetylglutamate kinase
MPAAEPLAVVKIGGTVLDAAALRDAAIEGFLAFRGRKALVHGGGTLASEYSRRLGIPVRMIDGRRITDVETRDVVVMTYAGLVNKRLVARLHAGGTRAVGICGADGDLLRAERRSGPIDYGFVGDVCAVDVSLLRLILDSGAVPVIAPISHDGSGELLNTNADTVAAETAVALSDGSDVHLVFVSDRPGVLQDASDGTVAIGCLSPGEFEDMREHGTVSGGMLPKLHSGFSALRAGVSKVTICDAPGLRNLAAGIRVGTELRP